MASLSSLTARLSKLESKYGDTGYKWLFISMTNNSTSDGLITVVYDISNKSDLRMENTDKLPTDEFLALAEDTLGVKLKEEYYSSKNDITWIGSNQR